MRESRSQSSKDSETEATALAQSVVEPVWLDYGRAAKSRRFMTQLAAACSAGAFLWTASGAGRTVECLEPHRGGYRLRSRHSLDASFPDLPGRDTEDEADIASLAVDGGHLWLSGSHSRMRADGGNGAVDARIVPRRSRNLLGAVALATDGGRLEAPAQALPFAGRRSLRRRLGNDPYFAPFVEIPGRENGLDVAGLVVRGEQVLLGLRGPLLDNHAVIVELTRSKATLFFAAEPTLHFLDLGGLGVRQITPQGPAMFVLGGPVSSAPGPFALYRWRPRQSARPQKPTAIYRWPEGGEHPSGLCLLDRGGRPGLLVLYDGGEGRRIDGSRYHADWMPLAALNGGDGLARA
jgi:hypothetical protein